MSQASEATMLERDCLSLLSYVSKHRGERQTQRQLADAVGCSQQRISYLINSVRDYGMNGSVLAITASKYGYVFQLQHEQGKILDAIYVGRVHNLD